MCGYLALLAMLGVVFLVVCLSYPPSEPFQDYDDYEERYDRNAGIQGIIERTRLMENDVMLDDIKDKYKCELEVRNRVPSCRLNFTESDASRNRDVKCKIIQEAHTGRSVMGSYSKSGSTVLDEGRLRSSPGGDDDTCEMLPTDTLLYPDGSQFPICSKMNKNIYDEKFEDLVDIYEDSINGRCNIKFKSASRPKILSYSNYLDTKAKEHDIAGFQRNIRKMRT
nr:hypothetical protein TetV2_00562 [Oceanusvirus sp.]